MFADEVTDAPANRPAVLIKDIDIHSEGGSLKGAGFQGMDGEGGQEATDDLSASGDIDDGTAFFSDLFKKPHVGVGVPRLPRRSQDL